MAIAVHCLPSMLQDLIWLGIHEFFITDPPVDIFLLEFHGSFYYNKIYGVPLCHQGDRMGVFPCGLLLWTIRGAWSSWLKMKLLQAQLQQIPI